MASRGVSITLTFVCWNTSTPGPQTGETSGTLTLRWVKDGVSAVPTNAPAQVDATNAPGVYSLVLTAAECTCDCGTLAGKSSTANVAILPVTVTFEQTAAVIAAAAWDEILTGASHNVNNSAGKRLRELSGTSYTVAASPTPTALTFGTNVVQPVNEWFNGSIISFTSGALQGVTRAVASYTGTGGVITVDRPLPVAPAAGDTFVALEAYLVPAGDVADKLLGRSLAGGADGGRTVRDALRATRNRVSRPAGNGTGTVYAEDDLTPAWSFAVTTSSAADPVVEVDPS